MKFSFPLILIVTFLFSAAPLLAQWSNDPLQNLVISDTTGEQILPKLAVTSDGGCYISWFDNRNGNYSVYLQRLNALGEAQFAANGLLVSNHPQQSWLTDYDMTVDGNDNAIIVFNDIRNGGSSDWDIFAYKIAPDGSFLWGPDGIGLSDTSAPDFEVAPKAVATSANNVVVAWFKSAGTDRLGLQKISPAGQKLWGDYGITLHPGGGARLSAPTLTAAESDSVILLWKSSTGPAWAPTTYLYTQKYTPQGTEAWTSGGVLVYNLGKISAWTDPQMYPDGNGGAYSTWYDAPSLSEFRVWVQHVSAQGNLVFPLNGIQATTDQTRLHMYPALARLPQSAEVYSFWIEENINQNQYGIYGQKISAQGNLLWGSAGKQLIGLGGNTISFLNCAAADSGIYLSYFRSSAPAVNDAAVKAFRLNTDGGFLWNPVLLSSASLGNKDDLLMAVNTQNRAFLTWKDDRQDGGIYAQNVNPDGSLGNSPSVLPPEEEHLLAGFRLEPNYPNPFNPTTHLVFQLAESGRVELAIFNVLGVRVRTLLNRKLAAGYHLVQWDGRNDRGWPVNSGIYFYRLQANGFSQTRRMILLK